MYTTHQDVKKISTILTFVSLNRIPRYPPSPFTCHYLPAWHSVCHENVTEIILTHHPCATPCLLGYQTTSTVILPTLLAWTSAIWCQASPLQERHVGSVVITSVSTMGVRGLPTKASHTWTYPRMTPALKKDHYKSSKNPSLFQSGTFFDVIWASVGIRSAVHPFVNSSTIASLRIPLHLCSCKAGDTYALGACPTKLVARAMRPRYGLAAKVTSHILCLQVSKIDSDFFSPFVVSHQNMFALLVTSFHIEHHWTMPYGLWLFLLRGTDLQAVSAFKGKYEIHWNRTHRHHVCLNRH